MYALWVRCVQLEVGSFSLFSSLLSFPMRLKDWTDAHQRKACFRSGGVAMTSVFMNIKIANVATKPLASTTSSGAATASPSTSAKAATADATFTETTLGKVPKAKEHLFHSSAMEMRQPV